MNEQIVAIWNSDYDNLIIAKKASNRPKDILDIEELGKANNQEEQI